MSFPILAYPKSPQNLCLSASLISCLSVSVWLFDCVSLPPCLRTRCLIIVCPSWCLQTTWSRCGWVILSLYSYWFPILFSFTLLSSKETVACGWGPLTNVALWKKKKKNPLQRWASKEDMSWHTSGTKIIPESHLSSHCGEEGGGRG